MSAHADQERHGDTGAGALEVPYDADRWCAGELGIASGPGRSTVTFVPISDYFHESVHPVQGFRTPLS